MDKLAIYHKAMSNYCYMVDEKTLRVIFKTKKNDFSKVEITYFDKYDKGGTTITINMTLSNSDSDFDYYVAYISQERKRITYYISMTSIDKTYRSFGESYVGTTLVDKISYYCECGVVEDVDKAQRFSFNYSYLNVSDSHRVPGDINSTIAYQIYPDSYFRDESLKQKRNLSAWSDDPKFDRWFGGNLKGVIDKIPYLKNLGVNLIYFCPVFLSGTSHRYDTLDYFKIDPTLGTNKDFRELVSVAHSSGIKIMLDGVFNHSSSEFFAFQDVVKKGEKSKYKDWYHIHKLPVVVKNHPDYDSFAFEGYMPKLNFENPEVEKYVLSVVEYWTREYGVDGWRLDVANEVPVSFWRKFRNTLRSINPDCYILGEVWHDSSRYLGGDAFDGVTDYVKKEVLFDYILRQEIEPSQARDRLIKELYNYTSLANRCNANILGTHDTARVLTEAKGDIEKLKLLVVAQFTLVGVPMIYYGDELGMIGGCDPYCRYAMTWDKVNDSNKIYNFYKNIIGLRKTEKCLIDGDIEFVDNKNMLVYRRYVDGESIYVYINMTKKVQKVDTHKGLDLMTQKKTTTEVAVEPHSFRIIKTIK